MRQRVKHKIIHAGTFKPLARTLEMAEEFASTLEPQQLISVTMTSDEKVIVWYRER